MTYRDGVLSLVPSNGPPAALIQVRDFTFRTKEFADLLYEFVVENGVVTAMKVHDPSGETALPRAK